MSRFPLVFVGILLVVSSPLARAEEPAIYKTKYRVIDVHRHCGLPTEAAIRATLEVDDRVGVSAFVILDGDSPHGNLPAWLELKRKFPDRLIVFWYLNALDAKKPTFFTDIVREVEAAAKQGVQGVKVWKQLGMYARDSSGRLLKADDERADPFWAKCQELGLPLLWHAADPREYWYPLTYNSFHYGMRAEKDQFYNKPDMPTWEELLRQREAILKRFPKLAVIGAHMGSMSFDLKKLADTFDKYPNFYADTSARLRILGRVNPPAIREFFTKYQDRILFGSDESLLRKSMPRKPGAGSNVTLYPSENADLAWLDPVDRQAVKVWQDRTAFNMSQCFLYFETSRHDIRDPMHSGGSWLWLMGAELPPTVLEKMYRANAERLIPGVKK